MVKVIPIYLELLQKDWTQRRLAEISGINETVLSPIIRGRYLPDELEKSRNAKALGVSTKDLFSQ